MSDDRTPLRTLAGLFFKLGLIGFGGPAAHIAMMEDEVVERRGWLTRQHFLDLVGATNLIPGPNSTEMTMHVGHERAGWPGLIVAGASFLLPAVLMVTTLAWLYTEYGTLPEAQPILAGIQPVVVAVILGALWRLGKKAIKSWELAAIAAVVAAAHYVGIDAVWALVGGGLLGGIGLFLMRRGRAPDSGAPDSGAPPPSPPDASGGDLLKKGWPLALLQTSAAAATVGSASLWKLGLFFLKVGAILYGSGYVLIAFLEGDLVQSYGWLTEQQLLDAVAIGQLTPGPVLTTATFIGYIVMAPQGLGWAGALVATLGIFLPSFVFVAILNPLVPRLRKHPATAAFLDAVNAAAVALMLVVTLRLAFGVLTGVLPWLLFAVAAVLTLRFRLNAAWLVAGGALVGWLLL